MRQWLKPSLAISFIVAISAFSGCANTEEYQRAGGDAIGKKCSKVAFTVDRFKLQYSIGDRIHLFFFNNATAEEKSSIKHTIISLLGDGDPDTTEISTEIYTIHIKSKKLTKLNTILPPEEWRNNAVSYSTKVRVLSTGEIYLTMRGCERSTLNCNKSKFFKIEKSKITELIDIPKYKKKELREQLVCASNTVHDVNNAIISYGSVRTGSWVEIADVKNGEVTIK